MKRKIFIQRKILNFMEKKKKIPVKFKKKILDFEYLDYGQIDSLEIIDFIIFLNKTFKIKLTNTDIASKKFRIFGGLLEIIDNKTKN
jgi:acyl carrier protein